MFRLTIESSSGPQCTKRLYVWIYILRAWGSLDSEPKHVAHIFITYLRTTKK